MNTLELIEAVGGETLPPADTTQLVDLVKRMRDQFGIEPPADYMAFLRLSNGATYNGLVVYGAMAILEEGDLVAPDVITANDLRRGYTALFDAALILGEVDDEFILYRPATESGPAVFQAVDRSSADPFLEEASFQELLAAMIYELSGDGDDGNDQEGGA